MTSAAVGGVTSADFPELDITEPKFRARFPEPDFPADLESFYFAVPAFAFSFGDAGGEVVADLGEAVLLLARRARAEHEAWLREVEGIDLTLSFLRDKRAETLRVQRPLCICWPPPS